MLPVGDTMMGSLFEKNEGGVKPMEECRVVPLDAYIVKHNLPVPSLMKIDIECAEVQCLRGSVELIKKHSPILIIEFHSLELLKEGYAFLGPLGYTLTTEHGILDDDFLHTLHRFHSNVICLPSRLGTG